MSGRSGSVLWENLSYGILQMITVVERRQTAKCTKYPPSRSLLSPPFRDERKGLSTFQIRFADSWRHRLDPGLSRGQTTTFTLTARRRRRLCLLSRASPLLEDNSRWLPGQVTHCGSWTSGETGKAVPVSLQAPQPAGGLAGKRRKYLEKF